MDPSIIQEAARAGREAAVRVVNARDEELRGRTRLPDQLDTLKHFKSTGFDPEVLRAIRGRAPQSVLVAEGDSWFDYPWHDVLSVLEDAFDYDVQEVAHPGDRIEDMAFSDGQLMKFSRRIEKVIRRGDVPRAILLSGGGNDIAGVDFHLMLNHADSPRPGLNGAIARGLIEDRLMTSYAWILARVSETCMQRLGKNVPVLVHGYDYCVPDGRGYLGGWGPFPGPWLAPSFIRKGYLDVAQRRPIIRQLMDMFNHALEQLVKTDEFSDFAHYVDLRKTLADDDGTYREWWDNELHPTKKGFQRVAAKFNQALLALT